MILKKLLKVYNSLISAKPKFKLKKRLRLYLSTTDS